MTRRQITPDDDYGTEWPVVSYARKRPMNASGFLMFVLGVWLVGQYVIPWVTERIAELVA